MVHYCAQVRHMLFMLLLQQLTSSNDGCKQILIRAYQSNFIGRSLNITST